MIGRNVLYFVDPSDPYQLPAIPGIYFLSDGLRLYCGEGGDLRVRVPASRRKHRFARFALMYPLVFSDLEEAKPYLKYLEAICISALFTVIRGHGLPHDLRNKDHAKHLPTEAWNVLEGPFELPIRIAQSVLFATGVPRHLISLPDRRILEVGLYAKMREFRLTIWEEVVYQELSLRKRPDHPGSPLPVLQMKWC